MASGTITTSRTSTYPGDESAARAAVTSVIAGRGGTIESEQPLSAKFGSQVLFRFVGGLLSPTKWFPVRAQVEFAPAGDGTAMNVAVADAMGVGFKAGLNKKYERAVNELADALAATAG